MRAARYYGPHDVRIKTIEPLIPRPGENRVNIPACGICGSDIYEYMYGPNTIPESPHP